MTPAIARKSFPMSKTKMVSWLDKLADQFMQMGFVDEADRARKIAAEVRALRG